MKNCYPLFLKMLVIILTGFGSVAGYAQDPLLVGAIADNQSLCAGTSAAQLTSTGPFNGTAPTYQWQESTDNVTFTDIAGATGVTYNPGVLTGTTYFRQLQNATGTSGGPMPTNVVTITIKPFLVVGSISPDQSICSGAMPALLTSTPPSTGSSPTYQWQMSFTGISFFNLSGGTGSTYQVNPQFTSGDSSVLYFRQRQNDAGTCGGPLNTNIITLVIKPDFVPGTTSSSQTICTGEMPAPLTTTAPPTGTSPTYQWQSSLDNITFSNISGATLMTYDPGVLTANTWFRVMQNAASTCGGPLPTNTVSITINPFLIPGSISADQSLCEAAIPALLIGTAPVTGTNPTYQWQSSLDNSTFTNITGATSLNYQPGPVAATTYYRQMQNTSGTCGGPLATNTVTITMIPNMIAGTISDNQAICSGEVPALLNGTPPANGTAPTYQWQSSLDNSTFTNISGATMLNYQPAAVTTTTHFRQLQNAGGVCGGPLPTNSVTISISPDLLVGSISGDQTICTGTVPATLTGTPPSNGTDPGYQWQISSDNLVFTDIAGATTLDYSPSALNANTWYRQMQKASGTCGGPLPTNTVAIQVEPILIPGAITADQTICPGDIPAMLTSTAPANGTSPTYQWQSSLDNVTFTNITGATSQNYQPSAISTVTWFRQMQDAAGTCGGPAPTNVVMINLTPDIIPGTVASGQTICTGDTPAMLTSTPPANGTSPTYQWQSSLNNITFTNINGATLSTYQPGSLTDSNTYFRQLQNAAGVCGGPAATNSVLIKVLPDLVPGTISASQTICSGTAPAQLTATNPAVGVWPSFQWQSSADNATFTDIAGATDINYTPGTLTSTTYFRQLQNSAFACGGPLPTNTITITVQPQIIPGAIGADQTICPGEIPAMLTSTAPANGTIPTYQWQSSLDNLTFTNITGATSMNYQPGTISTVTYFRQLQDAAGVCGGPAATNVVTISMNADLIPGTVSADQSICTGTAPAELTGTPPANGSSPVYQWQSSLDNVTFNNISGATLSTYQPGNLTNDTYYRQLQNASGVCGGPLPTNAVKITVIPDIIAGSISVNQTICSGAVPAMLTGTPPANGTMPVYQWQSSTDNINFTDILSAIELDYQPGALTQTTFFRQWQNATGVCNGPVLTNVVTITVVPDLIPGVIAADQSVCSNQIPALLTATPPANGSAPVYQWQSSLDNVTFSNINGATAQNYQPGVLSATTYFRQLQNATGTCGGPLTTNTVTISVTDLLIPGTIAAEQTICSGDVPALLTATSPVNGTSPVYQWQSSLDNSTFTNIAGATAQNYQPSALTTTTYFRQLQDASGVCGGPLPTNAIRITVTPAFAVGSISADQTICNGVVPALLTGVPPSSGTSPVYQWQSSLDNSTFTNINGATALNYQPGALTVTTYYRQIQDASGVCGNPQPTNTVTITVGAFPTIAVGSIASNQSLCIGQIPALLTGTPPSNGTSPVYQWQSSLDNSTFTNINGATALNYQPGALTATTYYRMMQNAQSTCGGPLPTNVVTISVSPTLLVGSISANQAICAGQTPAMITGVAPANGSSPSYQWQSSLNNTTFTNINGATALNYQPGALTTTTYYRQLQNASGTCGGPLPTNTVTITINPQLLTGSISANQSICTGQTPALITGTAPSNGTTPTYQWQSSLNNTTFTNITGATSLNYQPGALTTTTYYRQLQNASGTCGGPLPTNTVTITVNPLPIPTITGPASACVSSTGNVYTTQAGMTGYTWNVTGGTITAGANTSAITVTWNTVGAQSVSVNYVDGNGCTALTPAVYNVTVNPLPVPTITGPASACVSSTGNVYTTQTGMTGYTWNVTGGTITAGANTNAITVTWNTVGAQSISVNYINGNGCTAATPAVYNVTVNALPVPTITGPASACINSTGNVYTTQTGMTGYTWNVTGGTITAGANTNAITVTWNTVGAQSVSVNYINGNGCTAATPAVYNVTVNPLPVPTITGPASACINSTGNVYTTQTGMTGYTWNVTGGTITAGANTNAITVTWNTVGAQSVSVNYINGNGCTAATPAVYNVTVNPLPVPTVTGPASVCINSTGNVYTTQTGMTGYTWNVTGGTITAGATTNAITVTWNTVGAQSVSVNYINGNGCTAATPTVYNVTVNPLPVPTITGPASACVNSTGNVYTTQTGMTGYTWNVTGGTITAGATTNAITVTWNTVGAQSVSVNYINGNGCTAATPAVYNVTVNPLPVPTITGPASACVNSTGNVYTTQTGMTGYTWNVTGGTITAGAGTSSITVTWTTAGAQTVRVNYINASGCTATTPTTYNVTVNPLPVPTITGPATACTGSAGNVYTTQTGMTGYVWTVSAGGTITAGAGTSSITVTWTTAGAQTVCVNYINANGCTATAPVCYNVTVNTAPTPTITGPNAVCQGATSTYTTQTGMTNYIWNVSAGGTVVGGGTSTSNTVTVVWNGLGAQTVSVNYTAACPGSTPAVFNVTVSPAPVPTIGSTNDPCIGDDNIYYTESGMTNYVWAVSGGNTFTGQGTSTINVNWSQPGMQTVTVNYTNAGGCQAAQPTVYTVFVSTPPGAAGAITGTATVCAGTNSVAYSTTPVSGATSYTWILPAGAAIATGSGTNAITVNFGPTATSGVISVAGTNQCGNGTFSTFSVTVNPLPAAAGTISGPAQVCTGNTYVFTVPSIAGATGYTWTVPTGATIVSGGNTNSATIAFGAASGSGIITVLGTNTCGNGAVSPNFNVTINTTPAAPVVTANGALLSSSAASGNQWYYEGTGLIPGATGQTYTATITGWYWCTVTVNGCTSDTSNHVYVLFVGQDELTTSTFNVYPVPSNGNFRVSIQTPTEENFSIKIYNPLGAKVFERNDVRTTGGKYDAPIHLGPVADGVYTVVFLNSKQQTIRKIVISKLIK